MDTSHTCGAQTLQEKIAVMQAFADGETVELYNHTTKQWNPIAAPIWDWYGSKYRIASKTLSAEDVRRAEIAAAYEAGAEIAAAYEAGAEIAAAYEAGAEIECCGRYERVPSWAVVREPAWCWEYYNYRVKESKPTLVTFYSGGGYTVTVIRGSERHKHYATRSYWTELS